MNILYLTNIFSDTAGGSEYIFWIYAKYMAKQGHNIYVMCYSKDDSSLVRLGKAASKMHIIELTSEIAHHGLLPQDISLNIKYLSNGLKALSRIQDIIDIVHSNTYIPLLLGGAAKTLYKKKHIMTIHDIGSIMGIQFLYRWFKEGGNSTPAAYIKAIAAAGYEHAIIDFVPKDAVTVPSTQTRKDVEALTSRTSHSKIYIVPNTIDLEAYSKYKNSLKITYEPCILYIGRLVFYKNIITIVKAFEKVLREHREAKLIIVGKGPQKRTLESYITKHGLKNNIEITGPLSQPEKLKLLARCTAVANPSIFEGFGIVILESWYFEKPVIASRTPPFTEIIDNNHNGLLANPLNAEEWADALLQVLTDKTHAKQMGANGLNKLAKHYTPEKIIQQLESIYYRILSYPK